MLEFPALRRHELVYMNKNSGNLEDKLTRIYVKALEMKKQ